MAFYAYGDEKWMNERRTFEGQTKATGKLKDAHVC